MAVIKNYRLLYRLLTFITLFVVIGISGLLIYSRFFAKTAEAVWFDDTFRYRKPVVLENGGSEETDQYILLTVDTSSLVTAGKLQSDCDDIRFADASGTELAYFIKRTCNTTTTNFFVQMATIPAGSTTIYMYYGNSTASTGETSSLYTNTLTTNLISFWRMEESSGTRYDMVSTNDLSESASISSTTGKIGSAPNFTDSPYLAKTDNAALSTGDIDFTVAGWVYLDVDNQFDTIFTKENSSTDREYILWYDGNGTVSANRFVFRVRSSGGVDGTVTAANFGDAAVSTWYFVAIWHDAASNVIGIRVNATTPDTASFTQGANDTTGDLRVGGEPGQTRYLDGRVDSLGFWKEVLSSDELDSLYNSGNGSDIFDIFVPSSGPSQGTEQQATGPVAYWKLDEGTDNTCSGGTNDACNATGNTTFDGAKTSATWATEDLCISGKCAQFNGTFDRVVTGGRAVSDTFTLQAWVKRTANLTNNGACSSDQWYCGFGVVDMEVSGVTNDYGLAIKDNKAIFGVGNPDTSIMSTTTLEQGRWYLVTATRDMTSGDINLYVNGVLEATDTANTNSLTAGSANHLGNSGNVTGRSLTGFIDEAKIYDYIRTDAQIKADLIKGSGAEGNSAVLGSNSQNSTLSNGLVGYWKMDENTGTTTADSSGNGNTSSAFTGNVAWVTGKYGPGLDFDGADDVVRVVESSAIDIGATTDSYTVSIWVNTDNLSANAEIISKRTGSTYPIRFILASDETPTFELRQSTNTTAVDSSTALTIGSWSHLVAVRDVATDTVFLYINGVLNTTANDVTAATVANNDDISFGNAGASYVGADFSGSLDEARIYNRALSPAEVANLYNWSPGPSLYWKMDEGTGTSAYDTGGSSFTGTLTNATWANGKYGNAVNFDGTGDYMRSTSVTINPSLPFSLSAWMYTRDAVNTDAYFELSSGTTCNGNPQLWIDNSANLVFARCGNGAGAELGAASGFVDSWNHIELVFDGTDTYAYKNGVLTDTYTFTWPSIATLRVTLGGSREDTPSLFMNGMFDDFKMYSYARTQKQVIQDMNAGHPSVGSPIASAVGHWKFDEGADGTCSGGTNDVCNAGSAGSAIDGAQSGMAVPATAASGWTTDGKFNKALYFDGTNDYITVSDNAVLDITGAITVSVWFNIDTHKNYNQLLTKGTDTNENYEMYINSSGIISGEWEFTGTRSNCANTTGSTIATGTWYQVSVVFTPGSFCKTYLNGVLAYTQTTAETALTPTATALEIGGDTSIAGRYLDGRIDDVKIYNYALTESEVKVDYNRGSAIVMGVEDKGQNISDGQGNAPVGYWDFNEKTGTTTTDKSGSGNTGTLTLGPVWAIGKYGSAVNYDGSNDYTTMGDPAGGELDFADGTDFTIEGWFKVDDFDAAQTLVAKKTSNGAGTQGYLINVTAGQKLNAYVSDGTSLGSDQFFRPTANNVSANTWYHFAFVFDESSSANSTFYINGVADSGTATGTIGNVESVANSQPFVVGGESDFGSTFDGIIDEIKVYNYARVQSQIAFDYNEGAPIAHWKFDDCQGETAYDSAPNANGGFNGYNGTLVPGAGSNTTAGTCESGTASEMWNDGTNGKFNSAIGLDGTDDYISATPISSLTTNFSFAAWVYRTSGSAWQTVYQSGTGTNYWAVKIDNSNNLDLTEASLADYASTTTVAQNEWVHIAITKSTDTGANVTFYVNGKAAGTATVGSVTAPSSTAYIGKQSNNSEYFPGQLDDMRLYNYAISAAQVKLLMNDGSAVRFGPATGIP